MGTTRKQIKSLHLFKGKQTKMNLMEMNNLKNCITFIKWNEMK